MVPVAAKKRHSGTHCVTLGGQMADRCHTSFFLIVVYKIRRLRSTAHVLPEKKKKKVDYAALNSALMRIPRMDVAAVRNLIDLGIQEIFDLQGRAPEVLFEDARAKSSSIPADRIRYFRMAVYYAETENPEPRMLHPDQWR